MKHVYLFVFAARYRERWNAQERPMLTRVTICCIAAMTMVGAYSATTFASDKQWSAVAEALGKSGTEMTGGVYRVGMPRTDLQVTLDGVSLKPTFALGSWVAFKPMGHEAMVMGDLVLTENEIQPVMKKLQDGGLEITALHNHLLRAQPATFYMHVQGHGEPVALARSIHDAIVLSKTPLGNAPPAAAQQIDLDTAMIDQVLGAHGQIAGGVYQVGIPRADTIKAHGMAIPAPMGSAEAINFQPTGGGKSAITGDFVLTAAEVTPVMRTLRENGIDVTALHNHMLDDQPRVFFMHFWANDDAAKLAKGLRAALDKVNVAKQLAQK
jgi:biotin operon repressor